MPSEQDEQLLNYLTDFRDLDGETNKAIIAQDGTDRSLREKQRQFVLRNGRALRCRAVNHVSRLLSE